MNALHGLLGQLGPDTIQRMAAQLGASPQQTQSAIQAALPMLMGAMQSNPARPRAQTRCTARSLATTRAWISAGCSVACSAAVRALAVGSAICSAAAPVAASAD